MPSSNKYVAYDLKKITGWKVLILETSTIPNLKTTGQFACHDLNQNRWDTCFPN